MEARFVPEDCYFAEVSVPAGMDTLMRQLNFGRGAVASTKHILRDVLREGNGVSGRILVLRPGFVLPSGCLDY